MSDQAPNTVLEPESAHTAEDPRAAIRREVAELFAELHATDDEQRRQQLRERIVELNLPLVRHLARRYLGRREPLEDLVQVGSVGLLKAIERYDPQRRNDFAGFAVPTILGEIKRYFRDATWMVHLPRSVSELQAQLSVTRPDLAQQLGREPTVAELAEALDSEPDRVVEALYGGRNHYAASLDALRDDERFGDRFDPADDGIESQEQAESRAMLAPAVRLLPENQREVLKLRFIEDKTQIEISSILGVSQMQVSRLISRAVGELRESLGANDRESLEVAEPVGV